MLNTSGRLDFQTANISRLFVQPLGKLLGGNTTPFVARLISGLMIISAGYGVSSPVSTKVHAIHKKDITNKYFIFISNVRDVFAHDGRPSRKLRVVPWVSLYSY